MLLRLGPEQQSGLPEDNHTPHAIRYHCEACGMRPGPPRSSSASSRPCAFCDMHTTTESALRFSLSPTSHPAGSPSDGFEPWQNFPKKGCSLQGHAKIPRLKRSASLVPWMSFGLSCAWHAAAAEPVLSETREALLNKMLPHKAFQGGGWCECRNVSIAKACTRDRNNKSRR